MPQNTDQQATGLDPSFCRKIINDFFLQHPTAVGETYARHLLFSVKTGGYLLVTSIALVLHGLVPKFHQTTASDRVIRLARIMQERCNALNASDKK